MSTVKDAQGNILNLPAPQVADSTGLKSRYSGKDSDTLDWFELHPEDRPNKAEEILNSLGLKTEEVKVSVNGVPTLTKVIIENGQPVAVVPDIEANAAIAKIAESLPSAADLDAVAAEQKVVEATSGN